VEIWSTSLRVDQAVLPTSAVLDSVRSRYAAFHALPAVGIGSGALFTGVKAAVIGPDGRYPAEGNAIESLVTTPVAGGSTAIGIPQISTVVTLTTPLLRGKGSVGRMYLPPSGLRILVADGRLDAAAAQAIANAAGTFITDLNGLLDGDVSVFGQTGTGTARDVTGVRVGRVLDTQRRRRNAIPEGYTFASVTGNTGN
jgi:hypothetical protein